MKTAPCMLLTLTLALVGCSSEPAPHPGRPAVAMADIEVSPPDRPELVDLVKEFDAAVAEGRHAEVVNAGVRLRSYYPDAAETRARDAQTTASARARSGGGTSGRTYTPPELGRMVAARRYPDQGPPTSQTQQMGFAECTRTAGGIMASIAAQYPVENVVNTGTLRIDKAWTNDGAVTVTCSQPDGTMIITSTKYR